jgi:integrase
VRGYALSCIARGISPLVHDLTAASGANFLAELGTRGMLSSGTIRVYRSALSTWWRLGTLSDGDNPMLSTACDLVLRGIALSRVEIDKANRLLRAPAVEITVDLLRSIGAMGADAPDPRSVMMWAAANVALYGFLRPGELLGSYANPKRALRPEQIQFFTPRSNATAQHASGEPPLPVPDRFTIDLGVTKADPLGKNKPKLVAAPPAVAALWAWMNLRRALSPAAGSVLFGLPGEKPLSMAGLLGWLADWYAASGRPRPRFTGKGFRRGATSTAMANGAAHADISVQAGWASKGAKMPETYASDQAKAARQLLFTRRMATMGASHRA